MNLSGDQVRLQCHRWLCMQHGAAKSLNSLCAAIGRECDCSLRRMHTVSNSTSDNQHTPQGTQWDHENVRNAQGTSLVQQASDLL